MIYEFDGIVVDRDERRLTRGGTVLEVSSRYFDALLLMVENPGQLISRERFLDEVWKGVPVTDEALSQCIANLRRLLGDDAARPRFIATVPKHGYRFVAPVAARGGAEPRAPIPLPPRHWTNAIALVVAGAVGGGLVGVLGGLIYGLGASPDPLQPAIGAASFLLVMLSVNILAAAIGGLGVGLGMAAAHRLARPSLPATTAGAALGGLVVGTLVNLLGLDAFSVLLGRAPAAIAGGFEGLLLGGAVGLGMHLSLRRRLGWPSVGGAAAAGGLAGAILPLLGGRLMGASLDSLAAAFPGSPLNIDRLGRLLGEDHFGLASQIAFGGLEGLLFGGGIALAVRYARSLLAELTAA